MFLVSTAMCVIHNFRSVKIKSISRKKTRNYRFYFVLFFKM